MAFHTFLRSAPLRSLLAVVCGSSLFAAPMVFAQSASSSTASLASQSPFGGQVVEDIIARVNDRIISSSDYQRALKEMDQDARQRGETMQQMEEEHKDLLRNLIDQELWLSKGKEIGITGETELVKQLDEIRKKYNLATMEDLEKAAQQQGVSFEDFKANLRNQIVTQQVMRQEVGNKVNVTPGEAYRYYEQHQQEYAQPESVHLAEILVSTAAPSGSKAAADSTDAARLALAKAKADDIEAKLKAGANFDQLARTESDGSTASEGGDLGKYERGSLAKVLEDATFSLKPGQFTQPIRTRQGYVIFKVLEHNQGGVAPFKQVEGQAEQAYFMSQMQPAIRKYLTQMREEAYIDIRPGYTDTGASPLETKPIYSAYTPPAPKKKHKVERSRYRETDHGFRQKGQPKGMALTPASLDTSKPAPAAAPTAQPASKSKKKKQKQQKPRIERSGKKEKIRFGQAPMETLPDSTPTKVEDAGAVQTADASTTDEPSNPLVQAPVKREKTRFSQRAETEKKTKKKKKNKKDAFFNQAEDQYAPAPPDPTEVANQQLQSAPLGLNGDTSAKKKKKHVKKVKVVGLPKTRLEDQKEVKAPKQPLQYTPAGPVKGAPGPGTDPAAAPSSAPASTPASPSGTQQ